MSRKQCRRKVWALVNPIAHAIDGARITSGQKLDQLRMRDLSAIDAFSKGKAGLQEWSDIVAMMNVCEHMAFHGVGHEAKPVCHAAHGHLIDAAKRYEKTKRMGLTGPGLQCLRELYAYHDLQRTSIALSEYEHHILATANRIKSGAPEVTDILHA